ncbi:MAG: hypothetical protein COU11_02765 [Candidatus Harrisonbacteria bacterium CG10_big_fil_rev_8_21_14_0_10_49_15]|uniref:DUF202 domain-containing protein n=1 Tax=Candidatus Harrisonbacteria bacterium CG10_big_fil_rev_8_21_14_0_10_49_15 TaxID=1974587 RepID=A0A2H0UMY3_9BACT|nr:MAG: hypothetical protein COU11_02765 [Candidatus Harrisonbacteria bacterium CG10_big_fil_rev_8_21_14_0_10_49_15]
MNKTDENLLLSEIQLLLAEKRTYYSLLRTGLAVFSVPLTVIVFLVATGPKHRIFDLFWIGALVIAALLVIAAVGLGIFIQAQRKVKRLDRIISTIKSESKRIAEIVV